MNNVFAILVRNELLGFLRSRSSLFWTLVFPVFLLSVMLFAFGRSSALGPVDIVFDATPATPFAQACRAAVQQGLEHSETVQAKVVNAAANAGASATGNDRIVVRLAADVHGTTRVAYDFNGSLAERAASRLVEMALARCAAEQQGIAAGDLVRFENTVPGKRPFDYGAFFATGILIMSFMAIGLNSTVSAIATLRERNTFKLYVCFPVSRLMFIGALIVARMVMMALSAAILLAVARLAFGIALPLWSPSGLRALPVVLLGAAMILSFGVLLASRARSLAAAELACNVTYYPLLFFSDLTIPMNGAPAWLRDALKVIPTNQFAVALRGVLLEGAPYPQFTLQLTAMCACTAVFLLLAARAFRWHHA